MNNLAILIVTQETTARGHLHEKLNDLDNGHSDVARERVAVFLDELGLTRSPNGNSRPSRNDSFFSPIEAAESGD
jgi:hypothetical protein